MSGIGPGAYNELRSHLRDRHHNEAAFNLSTQEALDQHFAEHNGPGGIRNHDFDDWSYDTSQEQDTSPPDSVPADQPDLAQELAAVLNRHSAENGSNTPDFILAEFLGGALQVFDNAVLSRAEWYDRIVGNRDGLTSAATAEICGVLQDGLSGVVVTSPHVAHAIRELERCGQTQEDPEFAESIVAAVRGFFSYGHSGGSARDGIDMLYRLLQGHALSPLTDDPDEWEDHTEKSGRPWWQNRRDGRAMSHDGGKTFWLVEDPDEGAPGGVFPHVHIDEKPLYISVHVEQRQDQLAEQQMKQFDTPGEEG